MPDFDPDAFLAGEQEAQQFDPDAFLAGSAPQVGAGETFVNAGANAVPFGKQLTDLGTASVMEIAKMFGLGEPGAKLTPQARINALVAGLPVNENSTVGDFIDEYRKARDTREARDAAGQAQHPIAHAVGTGLGTVASIAAPLPAVEAGGALVPEAVGGSELAAKALAGGLTGLGYGAASGLANSSADLTRPTGAAALRALKDAGIGAGVGTIAGAAAPVAAEGVARVLRQVGVGAGRRALAGGAEMGAVRKELPPEAIEEAVNEGALPLGGTVHGADKRLQQLTDKYGAKHGEILRELERSGVTGPDSTELGLQWIKAAEENRAGQSGAVNKPLQATLLREAKNLDDLAKTPEGKILLSASENAKRGLQEAARGEYAKIPGKVSPAGAAKKDVANRLRNANRAAVEAQAEKAPEAAAAFSESEDKLHRLYQAADAARRGSAMAHGRGMVSALKELAPAIIAGTGVGIGEGAKEGSVGEGIGAGALATGLGLAAAHQLNARGPSTLANAGIKGAQALRRLSLAPGAAALAAKKATTQ